MRQVTSNARNRILILLVVAAVMMNGLAYYFDYTLIPNITKVISILILLSFYYFGRQRMANVFLSIFLFSFLGDVFSVFHLGELSNKLSVTFYLGTYCLLIFVLLGRLKRIKYEGLVSVYLILVLVLNSYFLYLLYGVVKDSFTDNVNLTLSIVHGIVLIVMTFLAFAVYLSQETTQSIVFLVMVFSFVFSDVLMYICNLYVYFWLFDFVSNMLHIASLALLFTYVCNHHKTVPVKSRESVQAFSIRNREQLTA